MPADQKLADTSAERMRRPTNQYPSRTSHGSSATVLDKTVTDPVCGMTVDPATTPHRYQHQKRTYYFCSGNCQTKFAADPTQYLPDKAAPAKAVPKGTIYTCPMHPEIRQASPGSCPICGMALEPVLPTAGRGPNAELVDMTRRFWIGLVLTLPVFVLEMGSHLIDTHGLIDPSVSGYIQFILATPVVLWAGWPFFVRGAKSLVAHNLNIFTLIAMGTGVAYVYSVVAIFAPNLFRRHFVVTADQSPFISRQLPSSRCSCCSDRCWSCALGRRPRGQSVHSLTSRPRWRAV